MAFPTIPTTGASTLLSSTTSPANTTHTFPSLTTLAPAAGDLIIAIIVQYQGGTAAQYSSWGASLTEILDDALTTGTGNGAAGVAYKVASGSESGTFTVTSANSFKSVQLLMRIPAATWHGTTAPEVLAAVRAAGAVADPGALNPANWDAEDTLWISVAGQTETSTTGSPPTLDSPPTNYSGQLIVARVADAVGDITAGVAFRQVNAASEDVGTWTASNANRGNGIATVIAVRPKASVDHTVTPTDSLALADSPATAKTIPKSQADPLSLADSFARVTETARTPADSVALADQASTAKTIPKAVADSIALSDPASLVWTADRSSNDTVALSDSFSHVYEAARAIADALALTDQLATAKTIPLAVNDSVALADDPQPAKLKVAQIDDSVALADGFTRAHDMARAVDDSLALADAVFDSQALGLADSVALADALDRAIEYVRALADSVALADNADVDHQAPGSHTVTPDDTLALTDNLSRALDYARTLADSLSLADSAQTASETARTLADTLALADALARGIGLQLADSVALSDEATPDLTAGAADHTRQIDDTLGIADELARTATYERTPAETLVLADLFARAATYERAVGDLVALTDLAVPSVPGIANIDDSLSLEDELAHLLTHAAIRTGRRAYAGNGHIEHVQEGVLAR